MPSLYKVKVDNKNKQKKSVQNNRISTEKLKKKKPQSLLEVTKRLFELAGMDDSGISVEVEEFRERLLNIVEAGNLSKQEVKKVLPLINNPKMRDTFPNRGIVSIRQKLRSII